MAEESFLSLADVDPDYPTIGDRVQSTFIDVIVISLMMFLAASLLDRMENAPDWLRITLFISIWIVYEPLCTSLGGTIGNYMKGLRVRRHNNVDRKINILQALIRYLVKFFLGWLSLLTVSSNRERRAIHDFAGGSVMIKAS